MRFRHHSYPERRANNGPGTVPNAGADPLRFLRPGAVLLFALLAGRIEAGEPPVLTSADLPGLTILDEGRFDGGALYGYINGGADLFLEYGFARVVVQKVLVGGEEYTVESYEMKDDTAAMGMASIIRTGSVPVDSLGPLFWGSPYHVHGAASSFFLRVVTAAGTHRAGETVRTIAGALRRKITPCAPPVPPHLAELASSSRDVIVVRGTLGVQNGYDGWSRLLEGLDGFQIFLLPLSPPEGETLVADIRFDSPADRTLFEHRWAGKEKRFARRWRRGSSGLVLLEATFPATYCAQTISSALQQPKSPLKP